jgi:hypothetical protein
MIRCRPHTLVSLVARALSQGAILALLISGMIVPSAGCGESAASLSEAQWGPVVPGVEFARVTALQYCRSGSPDLAVVRLDPARIRLQPYHESEFPADGPAGIQSWQIRLGAPVVVNAGLYAEDRVHLGSFRRDGKDIGGIDHQSWKGLLVSGGDSPAGELEESPAAGILDLSLEADREMAGSYLNAVQSMMLLDRDGEIRVRRTDRIAPRTVVAELETGHLVILVTEGSYTLWETGALLRESGWGVVKAMALDGGSESNLVVASEALQYETGDGEADFRFRLRTKLPGVIAVWPSSEE